MSSGKVGEDAVPEVLVLAAAEEDVGDSLSPLSTAATGARDGGNVSVEEEVVEANLFSPQLHQQRALPLAKPLMKLQHFLGRRRRVPVCRAAFLVFPPRACPLSLRLSLAPSSERCPERV